MEEKNEDQNLEDVEEQKKAEGKDEDMEDNDAPEPDAEEEKDELDSEIEEEWDDIEKTDKEIKKIDKEIEKEDEEIEEAKEKVKSGKKSQEKAEEKVEENVEAPKESYIFALRTTANREDQVMDFLVSNVQRKNLEVYSVLRPHGMRGYIFLEAKTRGDAEQGSFSVPYARGVLPNVIDYKEIEHMLEQVKKQVNIKKNDIVEIISGPFKREKAKITRIDKSKDEVVVEFLEAAVPIPITVKMDSVKVIRRDSEDGDFEE